MIPFRSCLGQEIQDFLAIREQSCSTSAYAHDRQIMEQLDRYLAKTGCSDKNLTEQDVLSWISTLSGKSSTIANKVIVVRIFINFLLERVIPQCLGNVCSVYGGSFSGGML